MLTESEIHRRQTKPVNEPLPQRVIKLDTPLPGKYRSLRLQGSPRYEWAKLAIDRLCALLMGLPALPLIGLAALAVKLTSRGPILYSQTRLGLHGKPFTIFKIRTMQHNCETQSGARWSTPGDPRITFVGRILRKTHLDELPQLWNVLCGHMSLIGPRPERPEFVPQLERVILYYRDRMLVRPGLSGLAQVQLPADSDLTSVRRKLACDLYYVQNVSFGLDVLLLLATVGYLFKIPFALTQALLRIPGVETILPNYQSLLVQPEHPMDKTPPPSRH